jgi:hypothetical protein
VSDLNKYFIALKNWSKQRWLIAILSSIITGLVIALPTAIIENPIFGRDIAVTSWSIPVLLITSILSGMLFATYIRNESILDEDKSLKLGTAGALFSFLAVGCPVCNKIALIALGYSGAIKYFAPVQPYLAILGVVVLSYALIKRLDGEIACKILTK